MEPHGDLLPRRASFQNEALQFFARLHVVDDRTKTFEKFSSSLKLLFEGVQSFVVPPCKHLLKTVDDERYVDLDFRSLADAVETPDTLFQQLRIDRQIKQHQVMRELKIAAFAADLRAEKDACAFLFGEPCGVSIPLHEGQAFMENGQFDANAPAQRGVNDGYCFLGAADQQYLLRVEVVQKFDQPADSCIDRFGCGKRMQLNHTSGKSGDRRAGVAEAHPPGAMAIQQRMQLWAFGEAFPPRGRRRDSARLP